MLIMKKKDSKAAWKSKTATTTALTRIFIMREKDSKVSTITTTTEATTTAITSTTTTKGVKTNQHK